MMDARSHAHRQGRPSATSVGWLQRRQDRCTGQWSLRRWQRFIAFVLLALLLVSPAPPLQAQNDSVTGTIIIAVAADSPPFAAQASNGQLVGFDVDLIEMTIRTAGLRVVYEPAPFIQLIPGVATQLYDAAIGCIAATAARSALVDFSDGYFTTGSVFAFSPSSAPVYDLTDLTPNTTISTVAESAGWRYLTEQSDAKIVATATAQRALEQAAAHLADAAFVDEISASRFMRLHPETGLQVVSGLVESGNCAIAVSKENPRLLLELNAALTRLKNNGKYLAIYRRWFGNRPLTGPRSIPRPTAAVDNRSNALLVTPTPFANENAPFADSVSGAYLVTVLTDPVAYQLIELTEDGRWLESAPVQTVETIRHISSLTEGPLAVQQGQWRGIRSDPLTSTVEISATLSLTESLALASSLPFSVQPRREYALTITDSGQLQGAYTLYTNAVLSDTTTSTDTTISTTVSITDTTVVTTVINFTGQRLIE